MLFAGLGIWLIFRTKNAEAKSSPQLSLKNEMMVFALILGIVGAYEGSSFSSLELLTASSVIVLSVIVLASIIAVILLYDDRRVYVVEYSKRKTSKGQKKILY